MKQKKTCVITFRTDEWVKEQLNECAMQNNWSQALVVEQICKNFIVNPEPQKITIWSKDLIAIAKELEAEGCGGAELTIDFLYDEENGTYYKELNVTGLEGGGLGSIIFDEQARELSEEEILNIP